ncbi:MAG: hypothetical protein OXI96_06135 [Acidimicrobiaceae bacterium]|nr:hypothetical protein [Acidimicrobiaceae bacterium]
MTRLWTVGVLTLAACVGCTSSDTLQVSSDSVSVDEVSQSSVLTDAQNNSEKDASNATTGDKPSRLDTLPVPETTLKPQTTKTPETTEQSTTTIQSLQREYSQFVEAKAPPWIFRGLVQLWPNFNYEQIQDRWAIDVDWMLRYWNWDEPTEAYPEVPLPGLEIECLGRIAMVADVEHGIEIGGPEDTTNGAFLVPWGGTAQKMGTPSDKLLEWVQKRPSNLEVHTKGDLVYINTGTQQQSYAMRDPVRPDGDRWTVQARHDGELFLLTVHPAHLPCYSGVTWISLAETGEFVTCGANTAATLFVAPEPPTAELILPDPDTMGTYLSCAPQLDLTNLPFTQDRQLTPPR